MLSYLTGSLVSAAVLLSYAPPLITHPERIAKLHGLRVVALSGLDGVFVDLGGVVTADLHAQLVGRPR